MLLAQTSNLGPNCGTIAVSTSAQIAAANPTRNGIVVNIGAVGPLYLLFGTGTASATNFHFVVTTTQPLIMGLGNEPVWQGAIQAFAASATETGVLEL